MYCFNNFGVTFLPSYEPKDIQIVAGSQDGLTGTSYVAAQAVVHPQYTGYDYQFACVQIDGQFVWSSYVKAVKLPNRKLKVNTKLTVAGWGSNVSTYFTAIYKVHQ